LEIEIQEGLDPILRLLNLQLQRQRRT
jgi:hypothetical protein